MKLEDLQRSRQIPWMKPVEKHPELPHRPIDYPNDPERCGRCGWRWSFHSSSSGACMPQPLEPRR